MGARRVGRIGWQGTASPTILRADFCESHAVGPDVSGPPYPVDRPAVRQPPDQRVAEPPQRPFHVRRYTRRLSNPAIALPPAFAKATADKLPLFEIHARAL